MRYATYLPPSVPGKTHPRCLPSAPQASFTCVFIIVTKFFDKRTVTPPFWRSRDSKANPTFFSLLLPTAGYRYFAYFCPMTPSMTPAQKATFVVTTLENSYPETPIPLDHVDAYTLLIAVLLSAQCTDVRVNLVTPHLFARAGTPQAMVTLSVEEIREIIKPCGLSPTKARAIHGLSEILLAQHGGHVPDTFEALEALPGVGHKTASVVMSQAFGVPAFPVDTHINRLMTRWGISEGKNVVQVENDAKRLFPEALWNKLHLQIIFFGRQYCPARGHKPAACPICSVIGVEE